MIKTVTGDLLEAEEKIIVHQVNCQGKMNSGIAKQIRDKFPKAYEEYMWYFKQAKSRPDLLGEVRYTMIKDEKTNKFIASLFGQEYYGYDGSRYTNYEAIFKGLEYIAWNAKKIYCSIAIPYKMGCDRGGANWDIVYKMIEVLFKDLDVTIYKLEGDY